MKFNFAIGFVLVLFVCSTAFANEHNQIASKLMQTQNCTFDISSYNVTKDNVEALRTQQLETIRNVHQITKNATNKLVQANPAFRTLDFALNSGLRFGSNFVTRPEDIQLGTGVLNYRKTIQSTGDVLKRFGNALNKMINELKVVANVQAAAGLMFGQRAREQFLLARKMNQIIDSTLTRMIRTDFRQSRAFHPIAFTVLNGFKFGGDFKGIGQFNWRKSVRDSNAQLKSFADGLIGIASKWKAQLLKQKESCELYLQDTFATVVEINPRSNTTVVVVGNNETMQANANSTTFSTVLEIQSNLTYTVSPVPQVQSNQTSTVSPFSEILSSLTRIVSQVTNQTSTTDSLTIQQLLARLQSVYNVTTFPRSN